MAQLVRSWAVTWPQAGITQAARPKGPRLVTVPAVLAHARGRVSITATVAVLGIVGVVAVIFGIRVLAAQRAGQPVPVGSEATSLVARSLPPAFASSAVPGPGMPAVATAGPDATNSSGAASGGRLLVVHVVGDVAAPGVVRVPEGARVVDAISAAGGALASADLERVNLARLVTDGEQVHVPAPGEPILLGANGSADGGGGGGGGGAGSGSGQPVDLNTADLAQLDTLPGVGPVLAQRIIDWRVEHTRFTTVDELGEVSGIGEKLLAQLRAKVRV